MDLSVWDYHTYANYALYGGTRTYDTAITYPYKWTQEKTTTNAIEGKVITGGTLSESEQKEPTTATYSKANSSITITQTHWDRALIGNNFKTAATRNSIEDSSIYYNLFINNGSNYAGYWLASRRVLAGDVNVSFGIRSVDNGSVTSSWMISSYPYENEQQYLSRPVVNLPSTNIDLSTNYGELGAWNLK